MNRHIKWGELHGFDTPPIMLVEVGQGDVVAEKEGVAVIIILNIECAPEARRHLQHETKFTKIVAAPDVGVKSGVGKFHP